MIDGKKLALNAMEKERDKLLKIAAKAKNEADEYLSIGSENIAIHNELVTIIKSDARDEEISKRLEELKRRQARVDRVRKKDFIKLCDKQYNSEFAANQINQEILSFKIRNRIEE